MENRFRVCGDHVKMWFTYKGKTVTTVFDTDDLERVSGIRCWRPLKRSDRKDIYIVSEFMRPLHRFVTNAPKGLVVDHINHDTLDNRKDNLRILTPKDHAQNRLRSGGRSGVVGVTFDDGKGRWHAALSIDGKTMHLGYYKDLFDAVRVVRKTRAELLPHSYEAHMLAVGNTDFFEPEKDKRIVRMRDTYVKLIRQEERKARERREAKREGDTYQKTVARAYANRFNLKKTNPEMYYAVWGFLGEDE